MGTKPYIWFFALRGAILNSKILPVTCKYHSGYRTCERLENMFDALFILQSIQEEHQDKIKYK